jgi:hypothetical protein
VRSIAPSPCSAAVATSGNSGERSCAKIAIGRTRPVCAAPAPPVTDTIISWASPDATPAIAAAGPLYGTCTSSRPAAVRKISMSTWFDEPTPPDA